MTPQTPVRHTFHGRHWFLLLITAMALAGCTQQGGPDKDPVTEVNTPRPTNNIPEHIPPERR